MTGAPTECLSLDSTQTIMPHQVGSSMDNLADNSRFALAEQSWFAERMYLLEQTLADVQTSCRTQVSTLEKSVTENQASLGQRIASIEQDVAVLRSFSLTQPEAVERALAEMRSSCSSDCEVSPERTERTSASIVEAERLRNEVIRKARERVNGQSALRDEVQFQQQALAQLAAHVDAALTELRAELPRQTQEHAIQRYEAVDTMHLHQRLNDLKKLLDAHFARAETIAASMECAEELLGQLAKEGNKAKEALTSLDVRLQISQEQLLGMNVKLQNVELGVQNWVVRKVAELEVDLRCWVDEAVSNHISPIIPRDCTPAQAWSSRSHHSAGGSITGPAQQMSPASLYVLADARGLCSPLGNS